MDESHSTPGAKQYIDRRRFRISDSVVKTKINLFGILRFYKCYYFIMKQNICCGDLIDVSAKSKTVFRTLQRLAFSSTLAPADSKYTFFKEPDKAPRTTARYQERSLSTTVAFSVTEQAFFRCFPPKNDLCSIHINKYAWGDLMLYRPTKNHWQLAYLTFCLGRSHLNQYAWRTL